jgi:hypothetical protein
VQSVYEMLLNKAVRRNLGQGHSTAMAADEAVSRVAALHYTAWMCYDVCWDGRRISTVGRAPNPRSRHANLNVFTSEDHQDTQMSPVKTCILSASVL